MEAHLKGTSQGKAVASMSIVPEPIVLRPVKKRRIKVTGVATVVRKGN